jgi:hypothetical protein
MEELQPEELEALVQELEGETGADEAPSPEVEELLRDLEPERPMELKIEAVRQLGELSSSNPQIVKALADASMWDASPEFRRLAAASLLAPVHQAVVEQHPGLLPQHVKNLLREMEEDGSEEAPPEPERVEDLLQNLQHGSSVPVRVRAAERLGQVDGSRFEIVQALDAARLSDPSVVVQAAAAQSLQALVHRDIQELQHGSSVAERTRAAEQLGQVDGSSLEIVRALDAARLSDPSVVVQAVAAQSLQALVHRDILVQHDRSLAEDWGLVRGWGDLPVTRPDHFKVKTEGSILRISWKVATWWDALAAGAAAYLIIPVVGFVVSGCYLPALIWLMLVSLPLLGYTLLVAFVNSTTVIASTSEWIVQRGPFPFPSRSFYSGTARIEPAAYREIRTVQVEEKGRGGSSSNIVGAITNVLFEQMGPLITYSLYARAKDGADKLLLTRLEDHEAGYLKHTLQNLLDAGGGPTAQE